MKSFKQLKKELLKDPKFKQAYDDLGPEFRLISLMIERRIKQGLTQKQLAKQLGTKQSAISRFESGTYNPSLEWMRNMARALNAEIKISIVAK
ncbi:MAG: helix-turn-helix transcriptional regulator [Patescibacteria group bacterium]